MEAGWVWVSRGRVGRSSTSGVNVVVVGRDGKE